MKVKFHIEARTINAELVYFTVSKPGSCTSKFALNFTTLKKREKGLGFTVLPCE